MKILAMLLFLGIFNGCTNQMDATKVYFVSEQTEIKNSSKLKVNNLELSKDIQAFISIENPNIRLQEPVILNFLVTNNLAEAIKLDLGADRKEAFLFWIVKPDGRKTQLPNFRGEDITRTGIVSIESQQTFSQRLLLNQWIQFSTPGRYILEGRLPESVIIGNKRTIKTDFNFNLTLNVGSEDKEHLKEISASLFQRLIESGNYEEAQEFAQALSYVNDPIAVPYLVKSLTSNKMVEPILIKGLERIGNKEAVQVLIDTIVDKPESEVALLATSSLQIIESNGLNVEGKQMAKQFLKSK